MSDVAAPEVIDPARVEAVKAVEADIESKKRRYVQYLLSATLKSL